MTQAFNSIRRLKWQVPAVRSGVISTLVLLAACDQLSPNNYEDCILKNIRGTTTDLTSALVTSTCRAKFPQRRSYDNASKPLDPNEQALLTGRADHTPPSNRFSGNIYNGNRALTVGTVLIELYTTSAGKEIARTYAVQTQISPLSASSFAIEVVSGDPSTESKWRIVGASGFVEPK